MTREQLLEDMNEIYFDNIEIDWCLRHHHNLDETLEKILELVETHTQKIVDNQSKNI